MKSVFRCLLAFGLLLVVVTVLGLSKSTTPGDMETAIVVLAVGGMLLATISAGVLTILAAIEVRHAP